MTVAQTILSQLGGNRFIAMTGARNMTHSANSLTVRFPRMSGLKANCITVTLTAMDDYLVEAFNIRGTSFKPTGLQTDIYAETLADCVGRMTGLAVRL